MPRWRYAPVSNGFVNQEVKQGVTGRRYCAPQACLPRVLLLPIGEMVCLLQQIVGERHR